MTWDHRYRQLEENEVIQAGDEVLTDGDWRPTICAGQFAPDPLYPSHRIYRRMKSLQLTDKGREALDTLKTKAEA